MRDMTRGNRRPARQLLTYVRGLVIPTLLLVGSIARADPGLASTSELEQLMDQGVPVVDVRTRGEWLNTGIIDGAHPLTFFDDAGNYDWKAWLAQLQEIARPDEPVVLMCHSGVRSAIIAKALSDQAGYVNVYDYESGIVGWLRDKRPTVSPPNGGES
jgi:rhodanese-related sulfurtransferase